MTIRDVFWTAVDQGLIWMLLLFAAVVWWGFRPWFQNRRRPPGPGRDNGED